MGKIGVGQKEKIWENLALPTKILITEGSRILQFEMACCGEEYSILLDSEGRVWGSGSLKGLGPIDKDALGESDRDYVSNFARLRLTNIEFVTSGKDHCLAFSNHVCDGYCEGDSAGSKNGLHSGARVYGWGSNDKYQLTQIPEKNI
jgi:alpha-tubulin suppressor-like RCC1 family protein